MSRAANFIDYTGVKVGKLSFLEYVGKSKWLCKCDCGYSFIIRSQTFREQNQQRCKYCFYKDMQTHGGARTPEYQAWKHMKERCYDADDRMYYNYGARGIIVCKRWLGENGFSNFLLDVGKRPTQNHSIDRIDVNGNYEPENCKWSTKREQMINRTNTVYLTNSGITKTLVEWIECTGLSRSAIRKRLENGWSVEDTLSTPIIGTGYTLKTIKG